MNKSKCGFYRITLGFLLSVTLLMLYPMVETWADTVVAFDTESFSVYGVVYTVQYGEYSYELLGNQEVKLSELLEGLKTGISIDEVEEVTTSNEDLLKVTEETDDWFIKLIGEEIETDSPVLPESEAASLTVKTISGISIVISLSATGLKELDIDGTIIKSADGIYLPPEAEGHAFIQEEAEETIKAVEEYVDSTTNTERSLEVEEILSTVGTEDQSDENANTPVSGTEEQTDREEASHPSNVDDDSDSPSKEEFEELTNRAYLVYEIGLDNVDLENYENGFSVSLTLPEDIQDGENFRLYHLHDGEVSEVEDLLVEDGVASFSTDSFSEFVLSYTVDFHWVINGKTYEFKIPGGGFVPFSELIEALGIEEDEKDTEKDEIQELVDGVENITFSNPELISVSKAEEDTTVAAIKKRLGLNSEYSSILTEDEIEEINAQAVQAGDWVLISLKPFDTEESLTVTMKNGDTFTIRVTDSQTTIKGATVHYGYMEGNTFREFTSEQFTPPTSGFGNPAYLIYDVPGYQYAGKTTHYYTTQEWVGSWYNGHYETVEKQEETAPIIEGTGSGDYYVYYEPRPGATQGGDISKANDYPDEPTVIKNSVENPNTGTNTISLEVAGKRKTMNPSKADIIVIYDISGSMKFPIGFNSETDIPTGVNGEIYFVGNDNIEQRNYIVNKAIKNLATGLIGGQDESDPAIRMALIPFSTNVGTIVPFTPNASTFTSAVDGLIPQLGGGTNWEAALQAANAMEVRSDADTYVVFVTDGNPTFRITRGEMTDADLKGANGKSGITDSYYNQYGIFGTGNVDPDKTNESTIIENNAAAKAIADAIVANNKTLFGIGISPEVTRLNNLISDNNKVFSAQTEDGVNDAIDAIKKEIKEITFGYSAVEINDGITALTQTVQKTGMTTLPDSDDFEYFKGHAATQADVNAGKAQAVGETVWEPWTTEQMRQERAGRASYEDGAVKWNLGETFMLEDGVSYKVDFTVWPSQEAYDLLADLNNGLKDYDALDPAIKAQIKKNGDGESATYTLKTNKDEETGNPAGYSYKKATQEEGGLVTPQGNPIPGTFDPVIPLKLRSDSIGVEKSFSNLLDSRDPTQIQLELWGNRLYKTFTLTKDGQWKSDNNYISCGLLTVDKETGVLYVYETGHDFTLKETGEDSIYWELTADTYHPMIINDVLHMLSKADAPEEMDPDAKYYSADGKEYYRIGGQVYVDEGTDAVLKAVNDHRSFLDLRKEVVNNAGDVTTCDDYFSFKAKFNESRVNDDIIFTVYDTVNKQYISDQDITSAALTPADDETNTTPYFKVGNKTEFTLKIKQGWNVRFLNLSNDTTYDIEEALGQDYEFVKIEGSAVKTVKTTGEATSGSGATSQVTVNHHMTITSGQKKMSGTIAEPNVQYSIKYTNKPKPVDFSFSKIWLDMQANVNEIDEDDLQEWDTSKTISVVLKRYTEKGEDSDFSLKYTINSGDGPFKPTNDSLSEDEKTKYQLTKTAESKITSFKLEAVLDRKDPEGKVYTYYVVEESAVGNNIYYGEINENDEITLTPGAKSAQKGKVIINQESIGYELPSTGGMGTTIFYLTGFALIFGASVCLLRRRTKSAA